MIYRSSRYTHTQVYNRDGNTIFKKREYASFNMDDCKVHIWDESCTLDGLAYEYYGDSQLWWVIADANFTSYDPFSIPYGSEVLIPDREKVLELYG